MRFANEHDPYHRSLISGRESIEMARISAIFGAMIGRDLKEGLNRHGGTNHDYCDDFGRAIF
jgi:hypothetical protein